MCVPACPEVSGVGRKFPVQTAPQLQDTIIPIQFRRQSHKYIGTPYVCRHKIFTLKQMKKICIQKN